MNAQKQSVNRSSDGAIDWKFPLFLLLPLLLPVYLLLASEPPTAKAVRAAYRSSEGFWLDRDGQLLQSSRVDQQVRRLPWLELSKVSPALLQTLVLAEDQHFYQHDGVDWSAMAAAAADTAQGEPRGGSTLTMQLAGLLDPERNPKQIQRSIGQKLSQLWQAWRLESHWHKPQILEAYLNLAPWRGELQGLAAASQALLGKQPQALDRRDSLLLVALLRGPNAAPAQVGWRACLLARQFTDAPSCPSLQAFVQSQLQRPPQLASTADFAPELVSLLPLRAGERRRSSLRLDLQRALRAQLQQQLADLQGRNVRDAALVVLDNASGEVLAWLGSPGRGGGARFVDGVLAPRQAGSTLKPLLYQLALQRRLLTAASLLDDSPLALTTPGGDYVPQNYDRRFRGPVSLRLALASSLNIPAVRGLLLLGLDDFHTHLQTLGIALPQPAAHYGYGLALGAAEVRLIDLANAYRTLANGGQHSPWRLQTGPLPQKQALLDPASSWIVADILADRSARAEAFGLDNALALPFWAAVKTGTSKDMRDNWCVGFSNRYTVAAWVGNADGESMWDVSGVTGAAPLWRTAMQMLHQTQAPTPLPRPATVQQQRVEFQPAYEPARQEYFLPGTAQAEFRWAGSARPQQILTPAAGAILAIDPDIPSARQQLGLRASGDQSVRWRLNGVVLPQAQWSLLPGKHRLELLDPQGKVLDQLRFEVRGRSQTIKQESS